MKFNKGVIKMQEQNPGYIILVRNGIFYTALGKDAVVLSEEFNQKQTCGGNNICKCGINIKNLEDFIEKLEERNYKYIVYDYVQGEKKVPKKRNKSVELMGEYIKQYVISAIDYYIKGE
jgi:DNA mismatch repair ATPase MutS